MKITASMKTQIRAYIMRTSYKDEEQAIRDEEAKLAEEIRLAWNGGEDLTRQMDELPAHFFQMRHSAVGAHYYAAGRVNLRESARYTALPHEDFNANQFRQRSDILESKQVALSNKRKNLAATTIQAIDGYSTTKQALQDFPEFSAFLPETTVRHLPAVPVRETRELLCSAGVVTCEEKQ